MISIQNPLLSCGRCAASFLVLSLQIALFGCKYQSLARDANHSEQSFNDNWTEQPFIDIPANWVAVSASHSVDTKIRELVPNGQTADRWTDMITLVISVRHEGQTIETALRLMSQVAQFGCATQEISGVPNRFIDAGYSAAVSYEICHKTKRWGVPEYYEYKIIEGSKGLYQILRSWRFSDYEAGQKPPVTPAALEGGLRVLDSAHVCDTSRLDRPCPPRSSARP